MHQGPPHNARQFVPLSCPASSLCSNALSRASQHLSLAFQTYVHEIPQILSLQVLTGRGHSLLFFLLHSGLCWRQDQATLGKAQSQRGLSTFLSSHLSPPHTSCHVTSSAMSSQRTPSKSDKQSSLSDRNYLLAELFTLYRGLTATYPAPLTVCSPKVEPSQQQKAWPRLRTCA